MRRSACVFTFILSVVCAGSVLAEDNLLTSYWKEQKGSARDYAMAVPGSGDTKALVGLKGTVIRCDAVLDTGTFHRVFRTRILEPRAARQGPAGRVLHRDRRTGVHPPLCRGHTSQGQRRLCLGHGGRG